MILPRLAASYYSNSAPLIWSFWKGNRKTEVELITDTAPSRCAEMLARGEVEIALTPVIEFQRLARTRIVPGVCIGAKEAVKSVVLVTKENDLRQSKTVALDTSSKTSVALTEIIFREFFGQTPRFIAHEPDVRAMLEKADAALLIGDPALSLDRKKFRVFDVAELWREFTGNGFVFAFWLARENAVEAARQIDFTAARDEGLRKVEEIIDFYSPNVPLARPDFRRYLTGNISYTLDEELLSGLRLFYQLAHQNNLIETERRLEFLN
jgi:chorismate dehydratase